VKEKVLIEKDFFIPSNLLAAAAVSADENYLFIYS
jgi:hypothetical protein